jgi:hypothetical protein
MDDACTRIGLSYEGRVEFPAEDGTWESRPRRLDVPPEDTQLAKTRNRILFRLRRHVAGVWPARSCATQAYRMEVRPLLERLADGCRSVGIFFYFDFDNGEAYFSGRPVTPADASECARRREALLACSEEGRG